MLKPSAWFERISWCFISLSFHYYDWTTAEISSGSGLRHHGDTTSPPKSISSWVGCTLEAQYAASFCRDRKNRRIEVSHIARGQILPGASTAWPRPRPIEPHWFRSAGRSSIPFARSVDCPGMTGTQAAPRRATVRYLLRSRRFFFGVDQRRRRLQRGWLEMLGAITTAAASAAAARANRTPDRPARTGRAIICARAQPAARHADRSVS